MLIDLERPQLSSTVHQGEVSFETKDLVSPGTVQLLARTVQGTGVTQWAPIQSNLNLSNLAGTIEVMARDESGNESTIQTFSSTSFEQTQLQSDSPSSESNSGCTATGSHTWAACLALLGLIRRRRVHHTP